MHTVLFLSPFRSPFLSLSLSFIRREITVPITLKTPA